MVERYTVGSSLVSTGAMSSTYDLVPSTVVTIKKVATNSLTLQHTDLRLPSATEQLGERL